MTERLRRELLELRAQNIGAALVFPTNKVWINKTLKRMCDEVGISDFRLHDCRHTFATRLVQAGLPIAELARLLGHTTPSMTYRYVNLTATTIERATELLNRLNAANG